MTRNGVTIARSGPSRRSLLAAGGGAAIASILRPGLVRATTSSDKTLVAAEGRVRITPDPYPQTQVWCYDGSVPGPDIRLRQGEPLRVGVENRLAQDTTVHWHGLRIPNAMDGAPYVTQPPIRPEESFTYEFTPPDAGTFWYHPHAHSAEQVGRGLMGALIIEEPQPPPVDRDVVWVLGDFRLNDDASLAGGFGNRMEVSMSGRIGNHCDDQWPRARSFPGPVRRAYPPAAHQCRAGTHLPAPVQGPSPARRRLRRSACRAASSRRRTGGARAGNAD